MNVVGERFRLREVFLPDVLLSARAMYAGLDVLRPHLASAGVRPGARSCSAR
jgi:5-methyltetrahydrofolate--homocysteine methyltransferase